MAERPRFFDDLAGVAGGAFSALAGMREEAETTIRARVDEAIRKFDLVKREDLEAVQEMAAAARAGQEAAERRLTALEAKIEAMSTAASSPAPAPVSLGPTPNSAEAAPGGSVPAATDSGTPMELPPVA